MGWNLVGVSWVGLVVGLESGILMGSMIPLGEWPLPNRRLIPTGLPIHMDLVRLQR